MSREVLVEKLKNYTNLQRNMRPMVNRIRKAADGTGPALREEDLNELYDMYFFLPLDHKNKNLKDLMRELNEYMMQVKSYKREVAWRIATLDNKVTKSKAHERK